MRAAWLMYVVEWDAYQESGVLRKVIAQHLAWRKLGTAARLCIVSPEGCGRPVTDGLADVDVFPYRQTQYLSGKFAKTAALLKLRRHIKELQPRAVLYRQSSWTPGLVHALADYSRKLIVEVNSLDVDESYSGVQSALKGVFHRRTRGILINACDAFVCVSHEISQAYSGSYRPTLVLGNGYDFWNSPWQTRNRSSQPSFIFVGTAGQPWHGVDKIETLAHAFPLWRFDVVGDKLSNPPSNVICHGELRRHELAEVYKRSDFGLSTLALHRKGMHEASPLKSREYLAHGLPVIGGYQDTDLDGQSYYLRLPNKDNNIEVSLERIRAFVDTWHGVAMDRDQVGSQIDWANKELRRIEFIRSLL